MPTGSRRVLRRRPRCLYPGREVLGDVPTGDRCRDLGPIISVLNGKRPQVRPEVWCLLMMPFGTTRVTFNPHWDPPQAGVRKERASQPSEQCCQAPLPEQLPQGLIPTCPPSRMPRAEDELRGPCHLSPKAPEATGAPALEPPQHQRGQAHGTGSPRPSSMVKGSRHWMGAQLQQTHTRGRQGAHAWRRVSQAAGEEPCLQPARPTQRWSPWQADGQLRRTALLPDSYSTEPGLCPPCGPSCPDPALDTASTSEDAPNTLDQAAL